MDTLTWSHLFTLNSILLSPAARGENVKSVIGYIGESVILKSDADPLWTLETIQWSIYNNVTYIATFDNNETRVNRWPSFEDRLVLNTTSGDLTIKNVMAKDKIKYKVHLQRQGSEEKKISFVQLDVRGENDFNYLYCLFISLKNHGLSMFLTNMGQQTFLFFQT